MTFYIIAVTVVDVTVQVAVVIIFRESGLIPRSWKKSFLIVLVFLRKAKLGSLESAL